jgi:hypothetical protein
MPGNEGVNVVLVRLNVFLSVSSFEIARASLGAADAGSLRFRVPHRR